MKNRVRQVEDELTNKEKQISDVQRKASEMKVNRILGNSDGIVIALSVLER